MKLFIGCDHAAFDSKEVLVSYLKDKYSDHFEVEDVGTHSDERCNYPDFAKLVAAKVIKNESSGILLCGSGIGVSMVANRYQKIRAALCRTPEEAALSRAHNDSNILCLGARINSNAEITSIVNQWLATDFAGGRHQDRIALFNNLGEEI